MIVIRCCRRRNMTTKADLIINLPNDADYFPTLQKALCAFDFVSLVVDDQCFDDTTLRSFYYKKYFGLKGEKNDL